MEGVTLSDIAALNRDGDGWGNSWFGMIIVLFFLVYGMNGTWGNNGFANAIGYENLATSNEVQRGFDNQNSMANEREILAAVNTIGAQGVATTNQVFHDMLSAFNDKYNELQRDVSTLAVGQQALMNKQSECCCEQLRAIDGVNYNMAMNANETQRVIAEWGQKILDANTANRMADMQNQINQLQLAQAMQGVVRYPDSFAYNAGNNPFCGCGAGCCNI